MPPTTPSESAGLDSRLTQLTSELRRAERLLSHVPGHQRGLQRHSREIKVLRGQVEQLIRDRATTGTTDERKLQEVSEPVKKLMGDLALLTTQVADHEKRIGDHDIRFGVVEDRIGVIERNPALQIDFERSRYVPVTGQIDRRVDWLPAVIVGMVTGVVLGVLASQFCYDFESWDWSLSKSIATGIITGLAAFLLFSSFERLTLRGQGTITWATRPTMEQQAEQPLNEQLLRHMLGEDRTQPPSATANGTSVQPAVQQGVNA